MERRKLELYLLNGDHPQNGGKAEFWHRRGFSVAQLQVLIDALLEHALNGTVEGTRNTPVGILYAIAGPITVPSGAPTNVLSVWELA
ncbi:MAG: hypothetical protein IPM16_19445 [Chloroflexi bacterium]|nr:hypothetical protein [Chloroflexota bacterium]